MPTLNAATNPELANQILQSVMSAPEPIEPGGGQHDPVIVVPSEKVLTLPAGHVTGTGEIVTEVEVRELTGRDEEVIAKSTSPAKTLQAVLERGTVRIGSEKATGTTLDLLLSGDRDWLLVNIYAATFGKDLTVTPYCESCAKRVEGTVDVLAVPVRRLESAYDRNFVVECGAGSVEVTLPTGKTQRAMLMAQERSVAELSTILLQDCVMSIKGTPLFSPNQILDMSIRDRRKISEEIMDRLPGPRLQDAVITCPECSTELAVPLSTVALFQFQ